MLNQSDELKMSLELESVSSESETLLATNTRLGMARRAVDEVYAITQLDLVVETPVIMIDNEPVPVSPDVAEIMSHMSEVHDLRRQSLTPRTDAREDYGLAA